MSRDERTNDEVLGLDFKGKATIKTLVVNGVPYMALADVLAACGYNDYAAEHVHKEGFPAFGKVVLGELANPNSLTATEAAVFLSPTGVYYWAQGLGDADHRTSPFTAWARKETRRLCPKPTPGDSRVYLALVADADGWTHVPPGPPSRYSGWKAEWEDLKDRNPEAWRAALDKNAEWNQRVRAEREVHRLADEESGLAPKRMSLAEALAPARSLLKSSAAA